MSQFVDIMVGMTGIYLRTLQSKHELNQSLYFCWTRDIDGVPRNLTNTASSFLNTTISSNSKEIINSKDIGTVKMGGC